MDKKELREIVRNRLPEAINHVNAVLAGDGVKEVGSILRRISRNGKDPHWLAQLKYDGTLPNSDGKTIGSIVEMVFLAVLEKWILSGTGVGQMSISPARGVDFPDLDLGLKSPSINFCTSEPFFSPYERLIGAGYDAVVLLTDYQEKKKGSALNLQITKSSYLLKSQIADAGLCTLARKHRNWLLEKNEAWACRFFQFLAYVNSSDWRCGKIKELLNLLADDSPTIDAAIKGFVNDFENKNRALSKRGAEPMPQEELDSLLAIKKMCPRSLGIIDAADNWVTQTHKDFARMPNETEWLQLRDGPLDGIIGMSYALQWRYNFGRLFNGNTSAEV